jgi:superfamily II DNA or RNA helicase
MNCEEIASSVTFTTYLSLNKHNPNDYEVVYLDECHSLLYSHDDFLSRFTGKIVGLTGTPPERRGSEKYEMVQKYCPIKYKFSVDDATNSNILNDYKIIVHMLDLSKMKVLKKNNKSGGHWYTSERDDYNYYSKRVAEANPGKPKAISSIMRMKSMMDYPTKEEYVTSLLEKVKSKCIIFANTQQQADKLCNHSFHSGNPNSDYNLELFSDGRIDKLSCVLQLSEGVTIPNLKQGIIMHAYGNERKAAQRIGRLLRLNPSQTSLCHVLCYRDTVDETWVDKALQGFDTNKVFYYDPLKPIEDVI